MSKLKQTPAAAAAKIILQCESDDLVNRMFAQAVDPNYDSNAPVRNYCEDLQAVWEKIPEYWYFARAEWSYTTARNGEVYHAYSVVLSEMRMVGARCVAGVVSEEHEPFSINRSLMLAILYAMQITLDD